MAITWNIGNSIVSLVRNFVHFGFAFILYPLLDGLAIFFDLISLRYNASRVIIFPVLPISMIWGWGFKRLVITLSGFFYRMIFILLFLVLLLI